MSPRKKFPHLSEMKEKLAEMAEFIAKYKSNIKNLQKAFDLVRKDSSIKKDINEKLKYQTKRLGVLRNDYRHMHIAYCELRGLSRERIEFKSPKAKPLSEKYIADIKEKFAVLN